MSNAILRAADVLNGQAQLARAMSVRPSTVNQWVKGVRPVPTGRCPEIERLTHGAVRCEDLRPDVDWAYLRAPISNPAPQPTSAAA